MGHDVGGGIREVLRGKEFGSSRDSVQLLPQEGGREVSDPEFGASS